MLGLQKQLASTREIERQVDEADFKDLCAANGDVRIEALQVGGAIFFFLNNWKEQEANDTLLLFLPFCHLAFENN